MLNRVSLPQVKPKVIFQAQYRKYVINPSPEGVVNLSEDELEAKAKQIYEWAKSHGASHYSMIAFPQTEGIIEKQQLFIDLQYSYQNQLLTKSQPKLSKTQLVRSEADGSSFPSEGIRATHQARSYLIWDTKSEIFIRKRNNVMYIPAMLVAHDGTALDDKTLLRNTQKILQNNSKRLLELMGVKVKGIFMALGIEQQFFVIPRKVYEKRIDIKSTGRALIGQLPPKNQQFSDHYYGKMPAIVEDILREVERQLLQIGVPIKTSHKQVAVNQFQFCPLFEEVGKAIDHNMIMMDILKETFNKYGYTALFHEKPFNHANGSGKHCNWSLNYADQNGKIHNLFQIPKDQSNLKIFKMFILINLQALLKYSKLYLSAISTSGNELRLGGHQAPPRIVSAFLGECVTSILNQEEIKPVLNLKSVIPNISHDLYQQNTDRNRTSPYAFAGNKFEFRAVGSSQNPSFAMSVIAATMAKEIDIVIKKIENGENIDKIIKDLTVSSAAIRFEGNGYSQQWVKQAKQRGLYVNTDFSENIQNIKNQGKIFVEIGACSQQYIISKYQNTAKNYQNIVNTQIKVLLTILSKQIIPRCFEYAHFVDRKFSTGRTSNRSTKFMNMFDDILAIEQLLLHESESKEKGLRKKVSTRKKLNQICQKVTQILTMIPKKDSWPQLDDFMNVF